MNLKQLIYSPSGKIFISVLLGLGLATMFRKACNERNCLRFVGPSMEKLNNNTYKFDDKCYSFKSTAESCSSTKKQVHFA